MTRKDFVNLVGSLPLVRFLRRSDLDGAPISLPEGKQIPEGIDPLKYGFVIGWLKKDEWTMGNGQCHVCCGLGPFDHWRNHCCVSFAKQVGHTRKCELAKSLEILGCKPIYQS